MCNDPVLKMSYRMQNVRNAQAYAELLPSVIPLLSRKLILSTIYSLSQTWNILRSTYVHESVCLGKLKC